MNKPEPRYCPCCLSTNHHLKYQVDYIKAASELSSSDDIKIVNRIETIIRDIWQNDTSDWYICNDCGTGFASPFAACNQEYYSITYTGQRFYVKWKWEYELSYNYIKDLNIDDPHLLEIGAGQGSFVNKISESLINKNNILCTEYAEYGKRMIESTGIECVSKEIAEIADEKNTNRFDIICMFQVLEHIDKLDETFEMINKLSKDKCNLFIAVPSNKHRDFYFSIGKQLDYAPGHISCFTPSGMRSLSERHGWNLISNHYQSTRKRFQTYTFLIDKLEKQRAIAQFIDKIKPNSVKKLILLPILSLLALLNIRKLLIMNIKKTGVSQLFWLKKKSIKSEIN